MSWRDLRDNARRAVHETMKVAATYISPSAGEFSCFVRVHERVKPFGDMTGFDYAPAEREEHVPEIVFLDQFVTEPGTFAPERNGIVYISVTEAWRLEHVHPRDGIQQKAQASKMKAADIAALGMGEDDV